MPGRVNETSWRHPITKPLEGGRWQSVDTLSESAYGESTGLVEPLIDLVGG